jgi:hypothetical protein
LLAEQRAADLVHRMTVEEKVIFIAVQHNVFSIASLCRCTSPKRLYAFPVFHLDCLHMKRSLQIK